MANQNLLTYNAKLMQVQQDYYSPSSLLPGFGTLFTVYCFLSKVDPYQDPDNPPIPKQDQQYLKSVFNNMIVAKKIVANGISPVIPRINWTTGTTYDFYRDDIDMFTTDGNNYSTKRFYVKNRYDQVFKCLWNNSYLDGNILVGNPSTVEPTFQPGFFNENNIFQSPEDGYKWKYMYTIDSGSKLKFLDESWMPVPSLGIQQVPDPKETSAGYGEVTVINVTDGGSGYTNNSIINVVVDGDGNGATAIPVVNYATGKITDVIVTNQGSDYNYATITITSTIGSGAQAIAPVSPIGGHNYNAVAELGCNHTMYIAEFVGDESGFLPTDIDYWQVGLLINPTSLSNRPNPANGAIYSCSTELTVASGQGLFKADEYVYQGSFSTPNFSGTVLNFDPTNNKLKLINTIGTPSINNTIFGLGGAVRTLLSVATPNFIKYSGYLIYVENRTGVQRSPTGIEEFKFVVGY